MNKQTTLLKAISMARDLGLKETHAVVVGVFMTLRFGDVARGYFEEWVERYQKGTHLYYSDAESTEAWISATYMVYTLKSVDMVMEAMCYV
ncbi:hypothetical protein D4R86_03770 [bacterium]|nr:MAG: hypothetical protein D4R86_03770 [bacterium]